MVEFAFGILADSLALIADAGHNLSDVLSLLLAWGATVLAKRDPTPHRTYGFRRGTILSSLISSVLLLVAMGAIAWEAVLRFQAARTGGRRAHDRAWRRWASSSTALTAWLFASGRHTDLNIRAAFLHMVGDAAVSVAVVIGGIGVRDAGLAVARPGHQPA